MAKLTNRIRQISNRVPLITAAYRFVFRRPAPMKRVGLVILTDKINVMAGSTLPIRSILHTCRVAAIHANFTAPRVVEGARQASPFRISGDALLINSISPLRSAKVRKSISTAIATNRLQWSNIFVYLHEGDFVFRRLIEEGYGEALNVLEKVTVIPLTHALKQEYEGRGWKCTDPVYNTLASYPRSSCALSGGNGINIVTVASFQSRKGVDRVVALARAAWETGRRDIHFHWIGPEATGVSGALPEHYPDNFTWWGKLNPEHLKHLLPAFDCVLLASYSDPLPLSVWEALLLGKHCFVAEGVGTSGLGISGVSQLNFNLPPDQILSEILAGLDNPPPIDSSSVLKLIDPKRFHNHLAHAIGMPLIFPALEEEEFGYMDQPQAMVC